MSQQLVVSDTRASYDLANALSKAAMVPPHFKQSVGDCYIAVRLADRFGMDVWTLMQEMYVIQGKAMMSGKLVTAILNNSLKEPLRPEYSGEGENRKIKITGSPDGIEQLSIELTVKQAKTSNEQWTKNPDQMLMYAGARMWGRRFAPNIILGIVFDDEAEGISDAKLVPQLTTERVAIAAPTTAPELIDEETGEIVDHPMVLQRKATEEWRAWGSRFIAGVRSSRSIVDVDRWLELNNDDLFAMREEKPKLHETLAHNIEQHKLDIMPKDATS